MTNRRPEEDMFLAASDAARMRQILVACSDVLAWGEANYGPQYTAAVQDAAEAAGLGRAPGALPGDVNLAIDAIDFSSPARRTR
jgi:hypothetical protein